MYLGYKYEETLECLNQKHHLQLSKHVHGLQGHGRQKPFYHNAFFVGKKEIICLLAERSNNI